MYHDTDTESLKIINQYWTNLLHFARLFNDTVGNVDSEFTTVLWIYPHVSQART